MPEIGSSLVPSENWVQFKIANTVLSAHLNTSKAKNLKLLNVTRMTARRKDGHSSIYYLRPNMVPVPLHRQDCSHWCLPGVPDTWNELLYALILKHEATGKWNQSLRKVINKSSYLYLSMKKLKFYAQGWSKKSWIKKNGNTQGHSRWHEFLS